jgi:hypothetical protein
MVSAFTIGPKVREFGRGRCIFKGDTKHSQHAFLRSELIDYDGVRLTSQNSGYHWTIFHPPGEREWKAVMMIPAGDNSYLSTKARWQSYQHRHLERVGGMDEGMKIFPIQYLWYVNGSLTWRKILRHGISGFTSHSKEEGMQRIFITLKKIHRLCRVWTRDPLVHWQAH